jgi:hypothetical protein
MTDDALRFDGERNLIELGGRRVVFHCHHYNLFLQRTIEDGLGREAAEQVQIAAGSEAARELLHALYKHDAKAGFPEKLARARALFSSHGFGLANTDALTPSGGRVALILSHYAVGYRAKWGTAQHPVCYFAAGYWSGALAAAAGLPPERLQCRELQCAAASGARCEIEIEVL